MEDSVCHHSGRGRIWGWSQKAFHLEWWRRQLQVPPASPAGSSPSCCQPEGSPRRPSYAAPRFCWRNASMAKAVPTPRGTQRKEALHSTLTKLKRPQKETADAPFSHPQRYTRSRYGNSEGDLGSACSKKNYGFLLSSLSHLFNHTISSGVRALNKWDQGRPRLGLVTDHRESTWAPEH